MQKVLERLFKEHGFQKQWENNSDIEFYINTDKNMVSYFIVNYIDCTTFENDEDAVKNALNRLEEIYMNFDDLGKSLKKNIAKTFIDSNEVAQIDKNTSAVFVVKFSDMNVLDKYRNLIYSIEESAVYFKRYILAYNQIQLDGLKQELNVNEGKTIQEVLTDLANDENSYYQLLRGGNHSTYELVIRLFSKIPFLQYIFKDSSEEYSLVDMVNDALDIKLKKYDDLISAEENDLEKYLEIVEDEISEEDILSKFDELLGDN